MEYYTVVILSEELYFSKYLNLTNMLSEKKRYTSIDYSAFLYKD